jgi:rhodanese-related sulfurtransferase
MREMPAEQLKQYLDNCSEPPLLLDVRQPWEFDVCKLEGSTLLPMSQIPSALQDLDPDRETVVICHHGIRSRSVARYLEHAGFSNVINLSDGVDGWAKSVDKTMATY